MLQPLFFFSISMQEKLAAENGKRGKGSGHEALGFTYRQGCTFPLKNLDLPYKCCIFAVYGEKRDDTIL